MRIKLLSAKKITICALLAISMYSGFMVYPAEATVSVWSIVFGDKVHINFCSNHDYYPRSILIESRHTVCALDCVRDVLVSEGKLRDIPIHIILPRDLTGWSPGPGYRWSNYETAVFLEENGVLLENEADEVKKLGPCYAIYIPHREESYEKLLMLTCALQFLTKDQQKIEYQNTADIKEKVASEADRFKEMIIHFDPIWSPDSNSLIYTVWQNGAMHLEFASIPDRSVLKLKPLRGYMTCTPRWSPDSKYIVYTSLKEARIFDTVANVERCVMPFPFRSGEYSMEAVVTFSKKTGNITVVYDTGAFGEWRVVAYYPKTNHITRAVTEIKRPEWYYLAKERCNPSLTFNKVTSPDGKYEASIVKENGLGRLHVRSIHGKKIEFLYSSP